MEADERAEEWYSEISQLLESKSGEDDAKSPSALVQALCRVLAEATEGMDGSPRERAETVASMVAEAMGLSDPLVMMRAPPRDAN